MNMSDRIEDNIVRAKLQGIPFDSLKFNPSIVRLMEEECRKLGNMTGTISMLKFENLKLIEDKNMPESQIVFLNEGKEIYRTSMLFQDS